MRGQRPTVRYRGYVLVHDVTHRTRHVGKIGQPGFVAERGDLRDAKQYVDRLLGTTSKRSGNKSKLSKTKGKLQTKRPMAKHGHYI